MGSPLGEHTVIWHVVSFSGEEAHQPSRVMGHSPCPLPSPASPQGPDGTGEVRQHVSGHVHQQEGRSPQQIPVPPDSPPPQVVSAVPNNPPSSASPGGGQQPSGCTIQESIGNQGQAQNPGIVSGVAPEPNCVSNVA